MATSRGHRFHFTQAAPALPGEGLGMGEGAVPCKFIIAIKEDKDAFL
jgi:hypothetical protein